MISTFLFADFGIPVLAFRFYCFQTIFNYLTFSSFDIERTWRVVRTKLNIDLRFYHSFYLNINITTTPVLHPSTSAVCKHSNVFIKITTHWSIINLLLFYHKRYQTWHWISKNHSVLSIPKYFWSFYLQKNKTAVGKSDYFTERFVNKIILTINLFFFWIIKYLIFLFKIMKYIWCS